MNLLKIKCPECGANLEVNQELDQILCNYCGTTVFIDDEASKITRIEKAKLESRINHHEQSLKEKNDNEQFEFDKWKKDMKIGLIAIICIFGFLFLIPTVNWICTGYFAMPGYKPNPSLAQYNSLNLGMSYTECKKILDQDGHLVLEENDKLIYEWYDTSCDSDTCEAIITLEFKNDALINRSENGLK